MEKGIKNAVTEKEKWIRRWSGEDDANLLSECAMPGCKNKIFDDCEYYTDDSGNIFCSSECVCEWYGIKRV